VQAVSEAAALRAELEITQREAESLAEEYERCEGILWDTADSDAPKSDVTAAQMQRSPLCPR
jgi:hypothetical protein